MRLLVTGGCGFIGSNYVQYLFEAASDDFVVNLDKLTYAGNPMNLEDVERRFGDSRYVFAKGDIGNAELVGWLIKKYEIEAVVNFAAESHVDRSITDPGAFVRTNVLGTQVLLDTARSHGVTRFVHVSTDEVYGSLRPDEAAFTEQTPLAPNSPYSASKAGADLLVRSYWKTYDFPVIITRCSNNYGPYQFPEKLIPLMYIKAAAGEPLPVYGDGLNVRDWIYVRDHCRGVDLALRKGSPGSVYNFGGNAEKPNLEVVRTMLSLLGQPESLICYVKDRPGHDKRYAMDYALAEKELGFEPEYDFERGLSETVAWYRNNAVWLESVQSGAYREFMSAWYKER